MYSASFNHEARSVPLILLSLQACSLAWSGVEHGPGWSSQSLLFLPYPDKTISSVSVMEYSHEGPC